jgi:hypothetical protein
MPVEVTRDGDRYLALDTETDEWGAGATEAAALADLDDAHRELLAALNEYGDDRLADRMRRLRATLNARIGAA